MNQYSALIKDPNILNKNAFFPLKKELTLSMFFLLTYHLQYPELQHLTKGHSHQPWTWTGFYTENC